MEDSVAGPLRSEGGRNRLTYETSPYLLQHADNPVDWFPWSDEAFRKATEEDKPVFLSIGYSSCHWCHVMEEESFEDPEVAALLNESFVAVKVDREERPDIDQAYMAMAQVATGQGGWPLTAIMSADGRPFFLGTYLPRASVSGRPGLLDLLPYVRERWEAPLERQKLLDSAINIVDVTRRVVAPSRGDGLPSDAAGRAFMELVNSFDQVYGGFGDAPKFPTPTRLSFLLLYWKDTASAEALDMVTRSLDKMRLGGIYDHLGHGFHRYSVDRRWAVPHFEKMLYDQALLVDAYLDAYLVTGNEAYSATVQDVLGYVRRRLTAPGGAFYCAEDADSPAGEGAYYLWTVRQLRESLDSNALRVVLALAGLQTDRGAERSSGALNDDQPFVLAFTNSLADVSRALGMTIKDVEDTAVVAKEALFAVREKREPVARDDKVLADWSGFAIRAFARAGRALANDDYVDQALGAADFVLTQMVNADGVMLHSHKDGISSVPGFLDDYASMALALFELYQAGHQVRHLRSALELVERMIALFWDEEGGGFHQAGGHGEALVIRVKPAYDGAVPSGNAMAGKAVAIAARLTSRADLTDVARKLFDALGAAVAASPSQYTSLLEAHRLHTGEFRVTTLVGEPASTRGAALVRVVNAAYAPDHFFVLVPPGVEGREVESLIPVARHVESPAGESVAYMCTRSACSEPTSEPGELRKLLG